MGEFNYIIRMLNLEELYKNLDNLDNTIIQIYENLYIIIWKLYDII